MSEPNPYTYSQTSDDIQIDVEPYYVPERSNPGLDYYFFAYRIRITNRGTRTCQLLHRHWIIRDGQGREEHVRGEGVVGEQPVLTPGGHYEYTSFCPLNTPTGNMRGSYEMMDDEKNRFSVKVPVFFFRNPAFLH